ncbi:hypothetical protein N0V90_001322 [Kalmusia sp. IMI 367209]|nr:hypothetical protein N0V90_001322 [Kalmusia sp. IMI 367209]
MAATTRFWAWLHSGALPGVLGNPLPRRGDNVVNLAQGAVRGFNDDSGNAVFLGIPFADTTGGKNRWRAPQPVPHAKKGTIFNATAYGATCPQAITGTTYSQQGEDCLNLNIWVPSSNSVKPRKPTTEAPGACNESRGASGLPVFVWMYGGAMETTLLARGVIFVSFNTRESIFAYPNSAELRGSKESQNFGILDVNKALQWVRDNIAAFGGNPDHIVFGGHSSGSVQVDHYLWNHPNTWLVGAVELAANAKSGPAVAPVNEALNVVAAEVGCPTGKGQLDCLRKVDAYAFQTEKFNATYNTWFTPAVDEITRFQNYESRFAQGKYASHVPLLTGNSNYEGALFGLVYGNENTNFSRWIKTFDADVAEIPKNLLLGAYNPSDYDSVSAMSGAQYGDARFFCPVDYLVDLRSTKQDTWTYRFFADYSQGLPVAAPTHGAEIAYFFGGNEVFDGQEVTTAQQALADFQNDWFVSWIKNPSAGPGWAKATPKKGTIAKLGVSGNELAIGLASASEYNGRCQSVYNPYLPKYPVIQSVNAA